MSWRYAARRTAQIVPTLGVILLATFIVSRFGGGDPAAARIGETTSPEQIAELRAYYGLDKPLPVQFLRYFARLIRGDLGESISYGAPVTQVIGERLGPTLALTGSALAVSFPLGLALGALAARRPYGVVDLGARAVALAGYAVPSFFLAQMAMLTIALRLQMLPLLGYTDPHVESVGLARALDIGHHLILPAMVLAVSELALVARLTRSGLVAETSKDYMRSAAAKGLTPWRAMIDHALPNALLPVVTVMGSRVGFLLSGAVVIEQVFAWPGLGSLLVSATLLGDRTLVLGMVLLVALALVIANLITDLLYARLDPRVRYR